MAKRFFAEKGVSYEEFDVSRDAKARDEMLEKTGRLAVPVIQVDEEIMVGFDRDRLEHLIAKTA